ncbi:hypothetical protein RUND412_006966 [Rhizina undulata]
MTLTEKDVTEPGRNIVLTPEEKKVFGQLFQAADSEKIGVITGELAVKFFEKSGLNSRILGEIWGIADTENQGFLTQVGFSVALRLIGQAQNNQHPRPELAQNPGPLPRFEGVSITYPPPPTTATPPPPVQPQATGPTGMIRVPPLTPQDVERFTGLFEKSGAVDGVLPGDAAKSIFQKAKLPNHTLGLIWSLADRQQRGALGQPEFVVAMHLITCHKNGSLPVLPQILPPGLYEAAAGRPATRNGPDRRPAGRGIPPPMPPVPPIPKQFSGPAAQRTQSPLSRQFTPPTQTIQSQISGDWAISPADKNRFDAVFLTVDKQNKGYITGEEAVPFFYNSGLPEEDLATIWDLADIHKAGRLDRDEFAIAMYLIRQQRNTPGARGLPEQLPLNLIPPAMRQQRQITGGSTQQQQTSPFESSPAIPPPPPKSAQDDLFSLVSNQATSGIANVQPSMGGFDMDVFSSVSKPISPTVTGTGPGSPPPPFGQSQRMFVPSSNFGQSILTATVTGGSNNSMGRPPTQPVDDLLGDADPEVSRKLTNETTELANLSNQIGNLTKQTQEIKSKRASTEQELSSFTTQKQAIEAQLAQLRTAYEREAAHVKRVEDQLAISRAETTRLRQEYGILEATYNDLQSRKQEITTALESDKSENENLKERMKFINNENISLKQELEKLQSQARQQRGLAAINKKQVAQSEMERERLKSEIDEVKSQVASPPPASPTLSQASVNTNPFYRRSPPAAPESAFSPSPFAPGNSTPSHTTLDDVFGPAFTSPSPAPTTPFQRAPTEQSGLSAPSNSEGGGQGDNSTPPTSPPGSSYSEAPPSTGSQITSAFLPLPISRADSLSSSVQVNPSASVQGETTFSRPDTPTNWAANATPESAVRERDASTKSEDRRGSFSVKSDAGTEASAKVSFPGLSDNKRGDSKSPFATAASLERNTAGTATGGDEQKTNAKTLEKRDSFQSFGPASSTSMSAFPALPLKQTPTGESNKSRASTMSKSGFGDMLPQSRSDPFGLAKDDSRGANSKQDFDDAFKTFGIPGRVQERQHTGGSGSMSANRFDKEFPPIEEINQDDDSESDNDRGFDDNFTTTSPLQTTTAPATTGPPPTTSPGACDHKPFIPPPSIESQQSPPSYQVSNPKAGSPPEDSLFPSEFSGLLPSRTNPMKHEGNTPGGSTNAVVFPSSSSPAPSNTNIFGTNAGAPGTSLFSIPPSTASQNPVNMFPAPPSSGPAPPSNIAIPDDFDEDFGDLAEAKEVDDKGDDNDFGTHSGFEEFNPVFDSPGPNASKSRSHSNAVASTALSDEDDFANFNFNIDPPTQQQDAQNKASTDDWDAIFAGMGNQQQAAPAAGNQGASNEPELPPRNQTNGSGNSSGLAPSGTGPAEGGGNNPKDNDSKVTKLTGMGFDRERSIKALEKHGYNIDQAANALLSDS